MLYHIYQQLKPFFITFLLINTALFSSSCALLTKTLDNSTGFSNHLNQLEINIRNEDWSNAKVSLETSKQTWKKLKPLIQIDIDHDYIKNIEDDFVELDAYLDTKDKSDSLASILLLQSTWQNIDSL